MKPLQTLMGWCVSIILLILLPASILPASAQVRMRCNLLIVDQTGATLMDGNMTNYNTQYSNNVDNYDIWKMSNFGENFGILRSNANLVIERRNIIQTSDTTFFRMWNVQQRNYRLQVIAENLHTFNLVAFVRDRYLNQDTPVQLNDTTDVDFTINSQAGSYAQNRFLLIYVDASMSSPLPVTFTGVQASRKNKEVLISWTVANELAMQDYELEQSADGVHFQRIHTEPAKNSVGSGVYQYLQMQPSMDLHYYRVKANSLGGKIQYSATARVGQVTGADQFQVYPNPVQNKSLQMQMDVKIGGAHSLSLVTTGGSRQFLEHMQLSAGSINKTISLPADLAPGIYRLQITSPNGNILVKTISVR